MKNFWLHIILILFCGNFAEAQTPTYTGAPDSSHVLVVYKLPANPSDTISQSVMNYYQLRRGIPETNIVSLDDLTDDWITDPATGVSHHIILDQGVV